jgi:hypothetical protein
MTFIPHIIKSKPGRRGNFIEQWREVTKRRLTDIFTEHQEQLNGLELFSTKTDSDNANNTSYDTIRLTSTENGKYILTTTNNSGDFPVEVREVFTPPNLSKKITWMTRSGPYNRVRNQVCSAIQERTGINLKVKTNPDDPDKKPMPILDRTKYSAERKYYMDSFHVRDLRKPSK